MAAWITELQASGIAIGKQVTFELPTAMRLGMVRGSWVYRPLASASYTGVVTSIKENQIAVWVESEKNNCLVHPAMCKPVK